MLQRLLPQMFALAVAMLLPLTGVVRADELGDKYLEALDTIEQAETFQKAGKNAEARTRYQAVQKALLEIKKADPTWKPTMVSHRLQDVSEKLAALTPSAATTATATGTTTVTASSATAVAKPGAAATAVEPAGVVLKLLSAGAAPLRAMRLQPKAGDQQKLEMTMNIAMEMSMAGTPVPAMNIPPIKFPLDLAIETVAADGDISFTKTMGEPTLGSTGNDAPGIGEAMLAQFSGLKGQSVRTVMSSRGVSKSADAKPAAGSSPQTQQSLEQVKDALAGVSVIFPEEPIGPGAKWEVKQVLKSQGMTLNQTTIYELTTVTGNRAEIKLTMRQSAASQKIASPMMPGMKMDLEKLDGSGTGAAVYDLTRLLPVSGEVESKTDLKMSMNLGGEKQAMDMKTSTVLRLESK